ncbi:MAG: FAD-dependent oxidoreductase [Alphaproteobacteria bacterium RIFCSPHIGHO2_12_FULL_63_12]|nr:MAG: FAD-dependent oxidoreductase [Alphaproteobacteria bacterium RIFCSPHIGHO2_12_FULL_63_12]
MAKESFDVVIIGGGHNGLVCAFYLARAGKKVCVLERREIVGGACITETFHPGFRNSVASYAVSLLSPQIIAEMDLARHGLKVVIRPMAYFAPTPDGRHLLLSRDAAENRATLERLSRNDAVAYDAYHARLDRLVDLLRKMLGATPPNAGGGIRDMLAAAGLANDVRKLGLEGQRDLVDFFGKSAGEILDHWFESDLLKGVLGFDAITGFYGSPYTPGSAYVLLHHVFGEANGVKGAWGHAIGGMGAITEAMAKACMEAGVEIRVNAPVTEVILKSGRAQGVVLGDGESLRARAVASNIHPQLLYGKLVPNDSLPTDFAERIEGWRSGSGVFRMNVALSELPNFTAPPSAAPARHHSASILISPSLDYIDTAFTDARRSGWSRAPAIEMHIPSVYDETLAPKGAHVANLFCQYFAPNLPGGRSWDEARDAAADAIIDTVTTYAPNFRSSMIARMALSPLDLERKLALVGGDIFHGQLGIDQLFSARPVLGHADYRSPIKGLFMCGSATHPGGGVTGWPGHNAAREILKDFSKLKAPELA